MFGANALKVTPTATTWAFDYDVPTSMLAAVSPSTTYSVSYYLYTTLASQNAAVALDIFNSSMTYLTSIGGSTFVGLTQNAFTRVAAANLSTPAGAAWAAIGTNNNSTWTSGSDFWIDAMQVEQSTTVTTWNPGPGDLRFMQVRRQAVNRAATI
jgi:hypothetical protein